VSFSLRNYQIQILSFRRTPGLESVSCQVATPTVDSEEGGRDKTAGTKQHPSHKKRWRKTPGSFGQISEQQLDIKSLCKTQR